MLASSVRSASPWVASGWGILDGGMFCRSWLLPGLPVTRESKDWVPALIHGIVVGGGVKDGGHSRFLDIGHWYFILEISTYYYRNLAHFIFISDRCKPNGKTIKWLTNPLLIWRIVFSRTITEVLSSQWWYSEAWSARRISSWAWGLLHCFGGSTSDLFFGLHKSWLYAGGQ